MEGERELERRRKFRVKSTMGETPWKCLFIINVKINRRIVKKRTGSQCQRIIRAINGWTDERTDQLFDRDIEQS